MIEMIKKVIDETEYYPVFEIDEITIDSDPDEIFELPNELIIEHKKIMEKFHKHQMKLKNIFYHKDI